MTERKTGEAVNEGENEREIESRGRRTREAYCTAGERVYEMQGGQIVSRPATRDIAPFGEQTPARGPERKKGRKEGRKKRGEREKGAGANVALYKDNASALREAEN